LLAYDGGKSASKALDYLTRNPFSEDLELHIITVAKSDRDRALAQQRLQTAQNTAVAASLKPICQLLEGKPEVQMEKYVEEQNIDFLIMGAYGHSRIRHLVIGSTTAQMLRSSHIPVLLFR
jgi:nucleotide-binding universal stress UspA family protein